MMSRLFVRFLLFSALWLPAVATAETPEDAEAARVANEVSAEVYSPFCPGKTLMMCTSAQAADVRRDVQDMAKSGMAKKEIKEKLIAEYGEEYRYIETDSFDNMWTFGLIFLGLFLAIAAVFVVSRKKDPGSIKEKKVDAPVSTPEGDDDPVGASDDDDADGSDPYLNELRQSYKD